MSKKKIKIRLSEESIEDAIRQVEYYKNGIRTNVIMFIDLMIQQGLTVAEAHVGMSPEEYQEDVTVTCDRPSETGDYVYHASIKLGGGQALFVEFSAGILHGTSSFEPLPNNPSYGSGYGMGTYNPDSDLWKSPTGWDYVSKTGEQVHTEGTAAVAPLYNADKMIRDLLVRTARAVWG